MAENWDRIKGMLGLTVDGRPEPGGQASATAEAVLDHAQSTQALGTMISTYGRHAFDLDGDSAEETHANCERWSRHLIVGAPPPGTRSSPAGERDLEGLRAFFSRHRKSEKRYVASALKDLRDAVWTFVRALGQVLALDQASDKELSAQIVHLKKSVTKSSTEEIKKDVLAVASRMGRVLAEREEQQKARMQTLTQQMRETRQQLEEARRGLETDPLTQLFNRNALDQQLDRTAALNLLSGHPACVAMLDIDFFKKVNDTHGHPAGDEVLRRLADCMVRTLPRKTDFIARYGGEEFAILFQQDSLDVARALCDRLLDAIRALRIEHEDSTIEITASIGLAAWDPAEETSAWIDRADKALYRAKQEGRNRLVVADDNGNVEGRPEGLPS